MNVCEEHKNGARSATFKNSGARSATIESRALGALKLAREARDENVPAKRADFFNLISSIRNQNTFRTNINLFDFKKSPF